jgi:hypothetical protein
VVAVLSRPGHDEATAPCDNSSITSHTITATNTTKTTKAPIEVRGTAAPKPLHHRLRRRAIELATHEARRLLIPLAILTAISSLGTAAAPGLATTKPLLLVALSPRLSFLAIAAPRTGLLPFLVVAGIRLCLADPFHFVLGRRHGSHTSPRLADKNAILRATHKVASHSIPLLVFLRPNGTNLAIAGASKGRVAHIAAADVVGTVVYLLLIHQLGASFVPH